MSTHEPPLERPLRVLLLSPLEGRDPLSGDTSYTRALLDAPPTGVRYTDYATALADGTLRLRGRRPGRGERGVGNALILALRAVELAARRAGVMFREPTWFAEIDPRAFDVVHLHLFALRQVNSKVPVVSSAGYPLPELYRFRERWRPAQLRLAESLELAWSRALRVHTPWLHGVAPCLMTTYTSESAAYLVRRGCHADGVRVISTGLPEMRLAPRARISGSLLFVGRDFTRKGGYVALRAYQLLRERGAEVTLTVITDREAVTPDELAADVEWLFDVDRKTVVHDVLPRADVMLAPTLSDCGAPYAVLEAMRAGVALVLSDSPWLDERLDHPGARRVEATPAAVADAVDSLLMGTHVLEAQQAALALFQEHFTMHVLGQQLLSGYIAVADRGAPA